jgi:DNA polymerase elongation subunit (family B)
MIIGVEATNTDLIISYYNSEGKISYMKKHLPKHEMFNWVEGKKPSLHKNWNGKYITKENSNPKWLSRPRLEELLIDKLTPEEKSIVYSVENTPRKDFIDIEIQLTSDEFPKPEEAKMPIGLISFCNDEGVNYVLSIMKSEEHPNGLQPSDIERMEKEISDYFKNTVPNDPKDRKILDQDFTIKYKFFEKESELLEFYFHKIAPRQSFLTGWNVIDFDWQYMMNRCSRVGVDALDKMSSRSTFSKRHKLPTHLGILDYMQMFQDPGYKPWKVVENYQLDYVSNRALNVAKLKHPYKSFREFQKDVYMFTMYNIIDNILVKMIDDKFGMLDVAFSVATTADIEVNKIFSPVHITEVLMAREFLKDNKRMMKLPYSSSKEEDVGYEGAYVMPPVPGYYDYVSCYDFKSMYPNLQMQFNCSPDTYLGKVGMVKTKGNEILTKNNTLFDGTKDSVARVILDRLYNARVDAQNTIKELKFNNKGD